MKNWFECWFDSPYYHLLYKNRDEKEACIFIDNLMNELKLPPAASILDLACGRGRHSIYLNKKGFDVTGVDLSEENIRYALPFENNTLGFYIHEMRRELRINYYDAVFNLFTSMGYFEDERDNVKMLKAAHKDMKAEGWLVIDFFNSEKVLKQLKPEETKTIEGVQFLIRKKTENGVIRKNICIHDKNTNLEFEEKVQALRLSDFERYFAASGFSIHKLFGNYALENYAADTSERLILLAKKSQRS